MRFDLNGPWYLSSNFLLSIFAFKQINAVNKEGMSRLPKRMQSKRVAPPAVPEIYRHSGSSFGSAGYGSCDDTSNMGGGSNFYATTSDPNNSLNVSLRSNASNSSSIDLPDNASRAASVAGK